MRGSDFNRFSVNPVSIDIPRARFERNNRNLTTFNAGDFVPIYVDDVLPGDTFSIDMASVARMTTPIHPVMDNAYLDVYFFFVPNRLVWQHWREFMGQDDPQAYSNPVEYSIPQIEYPNGISKGSVADLMGLPLGVSMSVNALPFRGLALIWNEWFRDQNTMDKVYVPLGDETITVETVQGNAITDAEYFEKYVQDGANGAFPLRVAKYHDYFTSALPLPQKGQPVEIGLGGITPLVALDTLSDLGGSLKLGGDFSSGGTLSNSNHLAITLVDSSNPDNVGNINVAKHTGTSWPTSAKVGDISQTNLGIDLTSSSLVSINTLRQAFQLQKYFEKDARGGTRYVEFIKAHFGVTSPDARQQIPEYLAGKRIPVTMAQVLQTSSTNETSPQGNTAAYSLTQDRGSLFTKSFTEHGYIIGVACVRTDHTYQQGIEKHWSRKTKYDFYDPLFANISEQPILNKEIFAQGTDVDDEAFGFQEAWAEYRYKPSRVCGALRSTYAQSLDVWHYGDNFGALPTLSPQFITATKKNVDRTLAVSSSVEDQFIADFFFKNTCVRPMPLYSIPGLIDHH